ncbi:MAG: photosystem II stability/assembly factor-like uncharacterized protein [Flavobacteriaceae bacterium]|jgi:photosystem II stability/assembly factor-like uncharacterized protein|uniref:T9SS type A sorting domain-containing protein n=1 Tax=Candidatus Marifrigoribacter sp. Uisw_064 TaxID=3230970 RepID=UPI003AE4DDA8
MKKKSLFIIALLIGAVTMQSQEYVQMIDAGTFKVEEIIENAETYFEDKDKGRGSGYKQFKRWEYNAMRLIKDDGYLPNIEERLSEVESFNAYLNETSENRQVLNDNWSEMGPTYWNQTASWSPGVGRITGISIDKNDSDHIIVGANTGGVWKTTNGGADWTPLGDYFSNLYVYSVEIDPSDSSVYYFGSGDGLIYKSADSGATWNLLGDMGSSSVNRLLIHPTDSSIMYATAQNGGIKKSTDGGVTWDTAVSDNRGYDLEFKPGNPNVVYATGTGFHKSTDGGATFSTIGGFTTGAKMLAVTAANDSRVYVVEASGSQFGKFYFSTDSGNSFTERNHAGRNYFGYDTSGFDSGGQAPRDMDITASPLNADEVHIAGVLTWRSTDGGVNFENTSDWIPQDAAGANKGYCHADVDLMLFDDSGIMFVGTDGGIFRADDSTVLNSTYYTDITDGLGITQFYKLGVSQTPDVIVVGGSQDNGSFAYKEAIDEWTCWIGADGMETFVDKDNSSLMFGTSQNGQLYRTANGGITLTGLPEPPPGSGAWVTPFEQDPTETGTLYLGYNRVFKSVSNGNSWSIISQDLGSNLSQMKIAPSNNQIMYAARGGFMYKTEDGGTTDWVQLPIIGGLMNSIAIHPTNPNKIAVASSSSANPVVVSEDGGATWINYKFNLPTFSSLSVIWDDNGKDGLYVGMDYGLFYIDDTFTEWQPYNNNLPNVIINELDINNVTNMLYAGSYGRGIWSSPLIDDLIGVEDFLSQDQVSISPNPTSNEISIVVQQQVEADIRIFDILGKLMVYQSDISLGSNNHTIDVSNFSNGVYFVRINSDAGTITKKIIKK